MKMDAHAWRTEKGGTFEYKLQINNIKHGEKSLFSKLFSDWKECGWGWTKDSEIKIMIKDFNSESEWKKWAKKCPVTIEEIKDKSNKTIRIPLNKAKRKGKNV